MMVKAGLQITSNIWKGACVQRDKNIATDGRSPERQNLEITCLLYRNAEQDGLISVFLDITATRDGFFTWWFCVCIINKHNCFQ